MILIKSEEEIKGIKEASSITAEVLIEVEKKIKPGTRLIELNNFIDSYIRKRGGRPAFLGYRGFPASACISLNSEVVHGIPDERVIEEGDLVKIDVGVEKGGFYGDAAKTFTVGEVSRTARKLVEVTKRALYKGIEAAKPQGRLTDISHAIEKVVRSAGFYVVKELGGHGVGLHLHEDPIILNYGPPGRGPLLKPGMVFAIEPMVNVGTSSVKLKRDGWTVVTADGSLSAHFEHTIAILEEGPEILTKWE